MVAGNTGWACKAGADNQQDKAVAKQASAVVWRFMGAPFRGLVNGAGVYF